MSEENTGDQIEKLDPNERPVSTIAWAALICGVGSWLLAPIVPFGVDVAAIVLGFIALNRADESAKRERLIARVGLWAGVVKLTVMALMLAWVIARFMANPVAH